MLKEFRAFVLRGNVVDLAIGVVIGAAFGRIVDGFTKGLVNPLVAWAGSETLENRFFCLGDTLVKPKIACGVLGPFRWGLLVNEVISFVIIAAVLFFFVVKPVNHLMERFRDEPKAEETRECPECASRIPARARRCAYCTAVVGTA